MAAILETAPITAEDFLHRPDYGAATELVRGKIVQTNRPHTVHAHFRMRTGFILQQYLQEHGTGRIGGGIAAVVTRRDPDSVRGPDVSFYSFERIPRGPLPTGYWPAAPELVIEMRSSDDRWKDTFVRAGEYLTSEVLTFAVADPRMQRIYLFHADREPTIVNADDVLSFPDVLPGFSVPVRKLFE